MTDSPPTLRPPRRKGRRWPWFALMGLMALGFAWSGLWYYGAGEVSRAMDVWLEDQRQQGNDWTCPARTLGGFPFEMILACDQPAWHGDTDSGPADGKIKAFRAQASVVRPDQVLAQVDGPLDITFAQGDRHVRLEWADLSLVVSGLLQREPVADALLAKPVATLSDGAALLRNASAASVTLHLNRNGVHPPADRALDAVLAVRQLASSTLNDAAQSDIPADIGLAATLTQVHAGQDLTLAEWLEIWRAAGGSMEVSAASLAKGPLKLEGQGRVSLDAAHRVQGQVAVSAAGLEPVLARFGIPASALNVGGLLSGLLGGKPKSGDGLRLALKLEGGKVLLGPLKLPVTLVPLY